MAQIGISIKWGLLQAFWSVVCCLGTLRRILARTRRRVGEKRLHQRANTWNAGGHMYAPNNNNFQHNMQGNNNAMCNNQMFANNNNGFGNNNVIGNNNAFCNNNAMDLGGLLNENFNPQQVQQMADHCANLAAMLRKQLQENIHRQFLVPFPNGHNPGQVNNVLQQRHQNRYQPY